MGRKEELFKALDDARADTYRLLAEHQITDADLDLRGEEFGRRGRAVRNFLVRLGDHMRQHVNQIERVRNQNQHLRTETDMIMAHADEMLGRVKAAVAGMTDEELERKPSADEWSVAEILAHLAEIEVMYRQRAFDLVNEQRPHSQ